ncbi:hypothetical protein OF83DRAFT_1100813 [Amylostereum chailletii]|nr:hypothetical protein OF83DRAFT_1100813 [Amylostereum chailletii]
MADKGPRVRPSLLLNNLLQAKGMVDSLSWIESASGPPHDPKWTCVCKIDGEEYGTGTAGPQKNLARDIAAEQALRKLQSRSSTSPS